MSYKELEKNSKGGVLVRGECPFCGGANIEYESISANTAYETIDIDGDGRCKGFYDATCDDCGKDFSECYDLVFSGIWVEDEA